MATADRPLVKPTTDMDDETFLKHMNARHSGFAGVKSWDSVEPVLRAQHKAIHRGKNYPTNHDHGRAR